MFRVLDYRIFLGRLVIIEIVEDLNVKAVKRGYRGWGG